MNLANGCRWSPGQNLDEKKEMGSIRRQLKSEEKKLEQLLRKK